MTWDRIIRSLVEIQSAIKEKMGTDGKKVPSRPSYRDGPGGFDRIQYEIGEIATTIRHIEKRAVVPVPPESGTYLLQSVDGVIQWVEPEGE